MQYVGFVFFQYNNYPVIFHKAIEKICSKYFKMQCFFIDVLALSLTFWLLTK